MKHIMIANTVITNRQQALNLVSRLNKLFETDKSYEMALVIDDYTERLVSAGFITWCDVQ